MSTPSTPFDFASNSRKLTSLNRPQYGSPFAQLSLRPRTSLPSISNLASQQQTRFLTFTPNGSRSLNQSIRNQQNPFEELSAGEFENFVDSVKRKIREALEPPAPSRDDAMINDEQDGMDVFGQVKDLREESTQ